MTEKMLVPAIETITEIDQVTEAMIGAAIEVHRVLGPGFLESVYEQALAVEMADRGIDFVRQAPLSVTYKGQIVGDARADFIVAGSVVVELKTVEALSPIHTAQVISYLKATRLHLGLLINFNVRLLKDGIKRIAL